MGHTPFGYRIENGIAVVDKENAQKIRKLYASYLSGLSLAGAAKEAGIEMYHCSAKRILRNRHYLGDDFYPAIIDADTFRKAEEESWKAVLRSSVEITGDRKQLNRYYRRGFP